MRHFIRMAMVLLLPTALVAQVPDLSKDFKGLKARSIGPAGMSGRVTAIDGLHNNKNVIWIGAASGGVWKTSNGGSSWTPVFDEQPTQNIGAIAIQQSNPSIVWVGTGEGNPRNSVSLGEGIYKTLDGGQTWKRMGLENTRNIHRILIDPNNPDVVYAGAIGNPFGAHTERGVYKSTDGGESWKKILYTNDSSGVGDMVMDPSNPNKILVNMWQHRRTPWGFTSGGRGGGLFITHDGGNNWKQLGKENGLPDTTGRMGLAIARSNPEIIYAMVEATKNALYRSEDGGKQWTIVNSDPRWVTNRPFYFQDIAVDPRNENRLYNIYQLVSKSEDGGKSFEVVLPYSYVHPDHHAWYINPNEPDFIVDGNDGGIAITNDRGKTWQFDEKLPLGQFYHVNVDSSLPYNVMGGLQDNGSWHGPAYIWADGGIRNLYWKGVGGGDGFDVMADPADNNWVYSMSQGGNLGRQNVQTGERWNIRPPAPDADTRLRFNWNAALAQDPFDKKTIYYGSQFVHKSTDNGVTWSVISPDLTTNDTVKQNQDNNGGLTIDITSAENHTTIFAIEPSSLKQGLIYTGSDDGQLYITRNGGKNWDNLTSNIKGMPKNAWIQQVRAGRHQAGEVFLVVNNYRQGDMGQYVFRSKDFGKTWTNMLSPRSNVHGYALTLLQDPVQPNLIFLGTENGLWISLDDGRNFQQFKNNYPSVSTYDLALQEREADLAIATFGRSLYILDDITPLRNLASGKSPGRQQKLTVFDSPTGYQVFQAGPPGIEWSSGGLYAADNRSDDLAISYFINPDSVTNPRRDSVTIRIYNERGEHLRTMKEKADSGYNKAYWNYTMKGVRQPGQPKPRREDTEPRGFMKVMPGRYKAVVEFKKQKDSTMVNVAYDPRTPFDANVYNAQYRLYDRLTQTTGRLTEAADRLTEMEETIKLVNANLRDEKGKQIDSLKKTGKAMQDSIKVLREEILGKRLDRQGYGTPYQQTVVRQMRDAQSMIVGKRAMPGQQEEQAIAIAEAAAANAINKINQFTNGPWQAYRRQVEGTPIKLFEDYTEIR